MPIDLTPFGFTPTESAVYGRLLALGPSSGYGIAKEVGLARANAYAALDGLVAKGAALTEDSTPKLCRPVAPRALLARIAAREAAKLDQLEEQISIEGRGGAPATVPLAGEREFSETALRTATREPGVVHFLGPSNLLGTLLPLWRKRDADGSPTRLFAIEAMDQPFALALAGTVEEDEVRRLFGHQPSVLLTSNTAIAGLGLGSELTGFWTTDTLLVGLVRSTVEHLTGEAAD